MSYLLGLLSTPQRGSFFHFHGPRILLTILPYNFLIFYSASIRSMTNVSDAYKIYGLITVLYVSLLHYVISKPYFRCSQCSKTLWVIFIFLCSYTFFSVLLTCTISPRYLNWLCSLDIAVFCHALVWWVFLIGHHIFTTFISMKINYIYEKQN